MHLEKTMFSSLRSRTFLCLILFHLLGHKWGEAALKLQWSQHISVISELCSKQNDPELRRLTGLILHSNLLLCFPGVPHMILVKWRILVWGEKTHKIWYSLIVYMHSMKCFWMHLLPRCWKININNDFWDSFKGLTDKAWWIFSICWINCRFPFQQAASATNPKHYVGQVPTTLHKDWLSTGTSTKSLALITQRDCS